MSEWSLSKRADGDLGTIYADSRNMFGTRQADRYIAGMTHRFTLLADSPRLGRRYTLSRDDLFRYPYKSPTIFYKVVEAGIFIQRILHQSMDPLRYL